MAQGAVSFSGVAEGIVGPYPPVFVVDSQARYIPLEGRRRWRGFSRQALHVLVALALFGMVLEAGCIIHLYSRTRDLVSIDHTALQLKSKLLKGHKESEENNEILVGITRSPNPRETEHKPTAHLTGIGQLENGVVMWESNDNSLSALKHKMDYKDGKLGVQQEGYYYVYSKVHFIEECSVFKHYVWRMTQAYSKPLQLMKANRYHCPSQKSRQQNSQQSFQQTPHQNILNSYLGGVFLLSSGDKIYVTVNNGTLKSGAEDNFMGAFMI
ncbi:hypothetical protein UPYG_G00059250 [Umbra pygmaea]|uniref:THD domain-containing protein n=1 Tax=Umbra pygmaea TaxID=75934 RepID=A0ABD0X8Y0_UMBPY